MQSGELESGLPDEAERESIVAWYLVRFRRSLPEQNCIAIFKKNITCPRIIN